MKARVNVATAGPGAIQAMRGLEAHLAKSKIEPLLLDLVKTRASQINGCAFCLDMHLHDARAKGETQQRLDTLAAWADAPFFTDRERAALAWTEAVTLVSEGHVPDEVFEQVSAHFNETDLVDLTLAVVAINGWNRLMISFRVPPPERP